MDSFSLLFSGQAKETWDASAARAKWRFSPSTLNDLTQPWNPVQTVLFSPDVVAARKTITNWITLLRFALLFSYSWENVLFYFEFKLNFAYYWWSEGPGILISWLLLRMCGTYLASVRLGFLLMMSEMNRTQSDHARLDLQSLVIWSLAFCAPIAWNVHKATLQQERFVDLPSISHALPNIFL